eukprot:7779577-Lingulodinium_polyedra.AAC.1
MESFSRSAATAATSGAAPDGLARPWAVGVLCSPHLGSAAITSLSSSFRVERRELAARGGVLASLPRLASFGSHAGHRCDEAVAGVAGRRAPLLGVHEE